MKNQNVKFWNPAEQDSFQFLNCNFDFHHFYYIFFFEKYIHTKVKIII